MGDGGIDPATVEIEFNPTFGAKNGEFPLGSIYPFGFKDGMNLLPGNIEGLGDGADGDEVDEHGSGLVIIESWRSHNWSPSIRIWT